MRGSSSPSLAGTPAGLSPDALHDAGCPWYHEGGLAFDPVGRRGWRCGVNTAVLVLHFVLAFFVIGVILLQGPKGEGLGAIGGSARLFHGPRPRETFFTRVTAITAVLLVMTSTYLAFFRQ